MDRMMKTKEAAEKWGYDQTVVWEWCRSGQIPGAVHGGPGSCWQIPADAKCPRFVHQQDGDALLPGETL